MVCLWTAQDPPVGRKIGPRAEISADFRHFCPRVLNYIILTLKFQFYPFRWHRSLSQNLYSGFPNSWFSHSVISLSLPPPAPPPPPPPLPPMQLVAEVPCSSLTRNILSNLHEIAVLDLSPKQVTVAFSLNL